jgi:hypothetical protein
MASLRQEQYSFVMGTTAVIVLPAGLRGTFFMRIATQHGKQIVATQAALEDWASGTRQPRLDTNRQRENASSHRGHSGTAKAVIDSIKTLSADTNLQMTILS